MNDVLQALAYTANDIKQQVKYRLTNSELTLSNEKKRVFVALAADYGNLGDLAITEAEIEFLRTIYPDRYVIECPISKSFEYIKAIKKTLRSDDIITLIGGGNIGDKYEKIEMARQFWMRNFPKSNIVGFPQSVDISKSNSAMKNRIGTQYSKINNLVFLARDRESYQQMCLLVKCKVFLSPDIVLSFGCKEIPTARKKICICMRSDLEKGIVKSEYDDLKYLLSGYDNVISIDTTFPYNEPISAEKRKSKLNTVWADFSSYKLVVTDRLHAIIFSYLTNTPCVAIDNSNHKIKNFCNTWLKDKDCSIFFRDSLSLVTKEMIEDVMNRVYFNREFDFSKLRDIFDKI